MKNTYKYIFILLALLWMILIFSLSHQPKENSRELSLNVTENIISMVQIVLPEFEFDQEKLHHVLRKNAHFFAYCLLGIFVIFAFKRMKLRSIHSIVLTMTICIMFAISDEVHQLFVPGRGAEVKDVFIDSAGAIAGMGLYLWVTSIVKKRSLRSFLSFSQKERKKEDR